MATGDTPWVLPSGMPLTRRGLCMLAQPCLRQIQHAKRFRFFEATLLLVSAGQLLLDNGTTVARLVGPSSLLAVAPHVCADVQKTPGGDDQTFRSLFLAFAPEVVLEFHRRYGKDGSVPAPVSYCREVALDDELSDTLRHCVRGMLAAPVGDRMLMHRLVGVLLALAERGIVFARPSNDSVGELLRRLLSDAPGDQWTTAKAGRALAMSEATLRRRLVAQNLRFESLLLEVRMHHAMTLLQTTRWSVQQIAEACGYRAQSRFSLRFRERFGSPPSRVR
jgi:AraC-like DNA-binding protein